MTLAFPRLLPWPLLAAVCATAWLVYAPGLGGGFLFDDFVNLDALGNMGTVDNAQALLRYVTSGTADPTGRPIALLSFLVDANNWPADPAPFLRTNLLLHLANGTLLFCLLRVLGRRMDGADARTDAVAVLGAGLWMLHPLLVSTTLYIVQREAMLAATFILLGLLAWLHGDAVFRRSPRAGLAWMAAGIGGGTLLALLCKANGALLPLLALVLRATVARNARDDGRTHRMVDLALLLLPSLVLLAYLAAPLHRLGAPVDGRTWTLGQRLLTEPRVLLDYLHLLVVPRALSTGLYNDAYVVSTGLWRPASTLPALLAVAALLAAGITLRRRAPVVAAGLLFFLAGHLLEAGALPLEPYFEHRNYLPALLLPWPLARWICCWRVRWPLRVGASVALLAVLAVITWQRATLWGQPDRMAAAWVLQNPGSSRAQSTAASYELAAGHARTARARLAGPWLRHPHDLQLALNYANAACASGGLSPRDAAAIGEALRHAREGDQLLHRWLDRAIDVAASQTCPGLNLAVVERWIAAAMDNTRFAAFAGRRQDLHSLSGRLALLRRQPDRALAEFDRALDALPAPQVGLMQAAMLASAGYHSQALHHLDRLERLPPPPTAQHWNMQRLHAVVLARQGYWSHEIASLRASIQRDQVESDPARRSSPAGAAR